ncbi:hypothetical protein COLO4_15302 [Corchorus olitorius]|uniref:Myb-like domain-containing protein n=1 Tax=Corchorus olitorius TaxID=93759 RepID=A0A1R3JND0_9ROSI|nr:hypothetical protein COLO4_15302 [Corchorus olitorius]
MFDGVPDQFHQFIASSAAAATRATPTLPLPLSFTSHLHLAAANSSNGFTPFDPFPTSNSHHHHFLHPLHQTQKNIDEEKQQDNRTSLVGMNMEIIERERSMAPPPEVPIHHHNHPWSNDEVLALLRIRSSMENWFPEFTWEHISRKLAELGFKRSAEKCKEKFEEESRYFNSINCSKNYRIFSELEELCTQGENPNPNPNPPHDDPVHNHQNQQQVVLGRDEKNKNVEKSREDEDNNINVGGQNNLEDDSRNIDEYQQTDHPAAAGNNNDDDNIGSDHHHQENEKVVEFENYNKANSSKINIINCRKRKRQKKFEMLKGFCEDIVNKLMSQQEEMHNKLISDMVKRDQEKVAREEAWKKQELDRINLELEVRAKEQAIAGDRQATIIKFLTKFSSSTGNSSKKQCLVRSNIESADPPSTTSSSLVPPAAQNPNPVDQVSTATSSAMVLGHQNIASSPIKPTNQALQNPNPKTPIFSSSALVPQNPNSVNAQSKPSPSPLAKKAAAAQNPTSNDKEDLGKRWPRDEVLALINLRCSFYNNGDHDKEGISGGAASIKAPLWERISQGMLELGYKRSAKRCKEKWENINKYFRKTKDVNKKRSLDSRTCPYFHQLSTLYNQGTLIAPSEAPKNRPPMPENHSGLPETSVDTSQRGAKVSEGETNIVHQVPAFEFEF